ncbi:hypothetical protein K8354_00715 [Polaribacter litorisediminis]|uniref:hypothetical protein n=1 Tax=Polaribacter litorisediminis TaxID=1908341 RepID=UPI001CBFD584|nr:hypothetical protein [Polaribacter litorisediminis]UAM98382.1 hypothetical protein K8354_00715 [Polaribacter litorisediminis]
MTEKTINILKSLKIGETYPAHKPFGKQEIEEQSVLSKLYNLEILKRVKYSYSVGNIKYLSKFIELQDFEKLTEYIGNANESKNGMKSTLEYKILKFLKDNENGKPISLDNYHKNESLLKSKIAELVKLKYITKVAELSLGTDFSAKGLRCKITTNGIKYLNEIESENKTTVNIENFIGRDNYGNQSSNFSNSTITTNNNANSQPTEKKNLISRFWKLISENKLISGILLLVIIYVLKVYFNIDLKNP